jgi:nucleotide-binding universal stress UspA family protein
MFKHILLPTDGSKLSEGAIFRGIELARQVGASVTGLYVAPDFHILAYRLASIEDNKAEFAIDRAETATRYLDFISRIAAEARVPCDTVTEVSDHPYQVICRVVEKAGCDLIVMASHGRRGVVGLLLGSETQRVLTHTRVPVMVWR